MPMINPQALRFVDIRLHDQAVPILWELLSERRLEHSISHRRMPSRDEHIYFVVNYGGSDEPYTYWGLLEVDQDIVGHIYLTARNEIGIQVFERCQRNGYARAAVELLMRFFGDREYLANINPANEASIALFKSLGFDVCQVTYRREARRADQ